jgi:hypothetical protein
MLKQAFLVGLLGTLGFASAGANASDHGYRPPPAVYVRPAVYPRPAYYPRYVYPGYAPRGWYGAKYRPPVWPRYGYRSAAPRYGYGRPTQRHDDHRGGGHDDHRGGGHGEGHGDWNRH